MGCIVFILILIYNLETFSDTPAETTPSVLMTDIEIEKDIVADEMDDSESTHDFQQGDKLGKRRRGHAETPSIPLERRRTSRMRQPNIEYWKDFV